MFISIEKACELTGRSKNALYRLMSKGHINFVRCTKGKRYLEVAELRRVYGQLNAPVNENQQAGDLQAPSSAMEHELYTLISLMREELQQLGEKVERQNQTLEKLQQSGVSINNESEPPTVAAPAQMNLADSPEKDPQWPPFITCYADLAKRDEIKAKYEFMAKYGKT